MNSLVVCAFLKWSMCSGQVLFFRLFVLFLFGLFFFLLYCYILSKGFLFLFTAWHIVGIGHIFVEWINTLSNSLCSPKMELVFRTGRFFFSLFMCLSLEWTSYGSRLLFEIQLFMLDERGRWLDYIFMSSFKKFMDKIIL